MVRLIIRPYAYLLINDSRKNGIDWLLPLLFSIATTTYICIFVKNSQIIDLVKLLLSFIQSLPGFFLAALAAVATFNRSDLDKIMPSPAPTIDIERNGGKEEIQLTRRRYLTLMFSFLAAESISLVIITTLILFSVDKISNFLICKNLYFPLIGNIIFLFLFFLFFWQLFIVSFYGLYYLGERIHQPN